MAHRVVLAVALTLVSASSLLAQSRDSVSFDATIGASSGSGGRRNYLDDGGVAGELTLTYRPHPDRETSWIVAGTVGGRSSLDFGDKCIVDPATGSGCMPEFPALSHFGILGGLERQAGALAMRVYAGPAFYRMSHASGAGAQVHLDGAAGSAHLALVAAIRASLIGMFTGERLFARSLEFGLRIQ